MSPARKSTKKKTTDAPQETTGLSVEELKFHIDSAWERRTMLTPEEIEWATRPSVERVIEGMESGEFRVAEPDGKGGWQVNEWLKKAVLLYFRIRDMQLMEGEPAPFWDKVPLRFTGFGESQFRKLGVRVVPGTVVVDDKWQREYATCRPDPDKWPDLPGWIARRHAHGQRVLLWWKAWDVEGAPPGACVRAADGNPVALDPDTDACRELVEDAVTYMLGPDGLDADGFKVDFIARTPSGVSLRHAGPRWGAALLHELLALVYRTAKRVKPDALIVTHTPNPAFVDVTDMIRLNDMMMLDAPAPEGPVVRLMGYRAAVVGAACPELLVDTDGWCLPDRATWAQWLASQPALGVPALYYATHVDRSGEPLRDSDLAEVARVWAAYRTAHGLPTPRP